MKNIVIKAISLAVFSLGMVSCKNDKAKTETKIADVNAIKTVVTEKTYKAIPEQTMISWEGKKIVGGHNGTINASAGVLNVKDTKLVGGNFIFDINTIKCLDLPAESEKNAKLIGHLKADDFFDVAKYPSAAFQITNVKQANGKNVITGNLTIKGVKKSVEFPANITIKENTVTIVSEQFSIDRTDFGVNYSSGKFTDPAKLGDYLIKDNVGIKVTVVASK